MVPGGACSGRLLVGDRITHVDSISVEGKDPLAVVDLCSQLLRVVLTINRRNSGWFRLFWMVVLVLVE